MRTCALVVVLAVFLPVAQAAAATTRVVDDDGQAIATDCNSATASFSNTIQAAVNASAPTGDTVVVCPGIYPEQVTVNKSVVLQGPQAGVDARTRSGAVGSEAIVTSRVSPTRRATAPGRRGR